MDYRVGLDIGIASVGWAVLENDEYGEPCKIERLGVRCFERAEQPKTGESLAAPRRGARSVRRRLRRRRHRLDRILYLFEQNGMIQREAFAARYYEKNLPNVYQLRYEGLNRLLTNEEFAQVLVHIAKHRGFKSTRKAELKEKGSDAGKVLQAVKENEKRMEEKKYRTVGEMFYLDEAFRIPLCEETACQHYGEEMSQPTACEYRHNEPCKQYQLAPRNKQGDYKHTVLRDMLWEEVNILFEAQRELGNPFATEELKEQYLVIMLNQRSFDQGPGGESPYSGNLIEKMVGDCTFEKGEKRAPKAAFTSERFVLFTNINNLRITDRHGNSRFLDELERKALYEYALNKKEVTYQDVRKQLKISETSCFQALHYGVKNSLEETEKKTKFASMRYFYDFKKILGIANPLEMSEQTIAQIDEIARILLYYKADDNRREAFDQAGIAPEYQEKLLELNASKTMNLSIKAMKKINVYLEQGFVFSDAAQRAGYDFQGTQPKEKRMYLGTDVLEEIPNPVVRRAISQTIKVLNAIIREYGSPQSVHIELAREMSKNYQDRMQAQNSLKKNEENNEAIRKELMETLGRRNPNGQDIVRYKLWKEQKGRCIYSGESIAPEDLFVKGKVDVDHIIPYSVSFDDSYKNKVLVLSRENRQKGNRTPYEYMEGDAVRWNKYVTFVQDMKLDKRKEINLLKEHFSEDEKAAFKERNLQDTRYITRVVYNLIRNELELAPSNAIGRKKQVVAVNGAVTAYMRKRWGLGKDRAENDRHHAQDAVVIACCTDGMIQKISRYAQRREMAYRCNFELVDEETGEIYTKENMTREKYDELFGVNFPEPWKGFRKELMIHLSERPAYFEKDLLQLGYVVPPEPMFISRMTNHKVTGAGHKDTIRSPRHYEQEQIVLTKTPIQELKLDKNNEIQGYYAPESDRLLYEALRSRLIEAGGNAKKAFAEPFYKPKADGSRGPQVKKVKLYDKMGLGVLVNQGTGIAANGSMVRVDVFREKDGYYFVPIYTADTVREELPNKASVAQKPYSEWKEMKDENFLFSLYSRDLVRVVKKSGKKVKNSKGETIVVTDEKLYYVGANISTASFDFISHDKAYGVSGTGIKTLDCLEKYQVDVLGNYTKVTGEKRMKFHPKQS